MSGKFIYDPIALDTIDDPYPIYDEMLANHPVHWHEQMQCWVVARYQDCREVLGNHELYARDRRRVGDEIPIFKQSVQSLDPPQQGPLRKFLTDAIKAQDLTAICRRGRESIEKRLTELREVETFDLLSEISAPYGLSIISELLGVQEPQLQEFVRISDAIARRMDAGLDPSTAEPGDIARQRLNEIVDEWFEQDLKPGVLSLLRDKIDQIEFPEYVVRNTVGILFNAGYSTTYATTGNATLTLLTHPEARTQLREQSFLATGVEELVRFDGPAQGTSRIATQDTTLGGIPIKRGDVVLTLFAAANRDPRQFERPAELLLDRTPNRHLGFGWGPHACLGVLLGEQALREYVSCIVGLECPLELAGVPRRRRTATLRCLDYLPVRVRGPSYEDRRA